MGPDPALDKCMSFFAVSAAGVAYLFDRNDGLVEVRWWDAKSSEDVQSPRPLHENATKRS